MKNIATARPTLADRYTAQAKADRRQAALDRRNERITELQERKALYANAGR